MKWILIVWFINVGGPMAATAPAVVPNGYPTLSDCQQVGDQWVEQARVGTNPRYACIPNRK